MTDTGTTDTGPTDTGPAGAGPAGPGPPGGRRGQARPRATRTGATSVQPGVHAVVIAGLPDSTDPSSVRVAARGAGVTLLNVEVPRRGTTEPGRESLARLRADVERWRDAVRELGDADEAERAGLGFLGHLSQAAATSL